MRVGHALLLIGAIVAALGLSINIYSGEYALPELMRTLAIIPVAVLIAFGIIQFPIPALFVSFIILFGGDSVDDLIRSFWPISPFWSVILLATLGLVLKNSLRTIPWIEWILLIVLIGWSLIIETSVNSFDVVSDASKYNSIAVAQIAGLILFIGLSRITNWKDISVVLFAIFGGLVVLLISLSYTLTLSWGLERGLLRTPDTTNVSILFTATAVGWFLSIGSVMSYAAAVSLPGRRKWVAFLIFELFVAGAILTFSRGPYPALLMGIGATIVVARRPAMESLRNLIVAVVLIGGTAYASGALTHIVKDRGLSQELSGLAAPTRIVVEPSPQPVVEPSPQPVVEPSPQPIDSSDPKAFVLGVDDPPVGLDDSPVGLSDFSIVDEVIYDYLPVQSTRLSIYVDGIKEMPGNVIIGNASGGTLAHSSLIDGWNNIGGLFAIVSIAFMAILFRRSYRLARLAQTNAWSVEARVSTAVLFAVFVTTLTQSLYDPALYATAFGVIFWGTRGLEVAIWHSPRMNPDLGFQVSCTLSGPEKRG
jgi:hypothetical protein